MDVRIAVALFERQDPQGNVAAFCREHHLSRQTFYVYRRRFRKEGLEGLVPQSRRPLTSPAATPGDVVAAVVLSVLSCWSRDGIAAR